MEPEQDLARYVVHRSGTVNANSHEVVDIFGASVLGWIEVEEHPEMLHSLKEAQAKACAALGIDRAFLIRWEQAGDDARRFAEQRGDVTKHQ